MQTIEYQANGETSDWMLHERGIIAMSPELGSDSKHHEDDQTFYANKASILHILGECFEPVF